MLGNLCFSSTITYLLAIQNNWPSLASAGQFFYILLLVAFIGLLAYYCTKLLASARSGRIGGAKRNLEVIEGMGVSAQSAVQIIRVGEKYFLIGVSKEHISLLAELDEAQIKMPDAKKGLPDYTFDKVMQRFLHKESSGQGQKQDAE